MKKYSDFAGYNNYMGILDNLENAWDFEFESKPIKETDNAGKEITISQLDTWLYQE
jgi:hypothetical protein